MTNNFEFNSDNDERYGSGSGGGGGLPESIAGDSGGDGEHQHHEELSEERFGILKDIAREAIEGSQQL